MMWEPTLGLRMVGDAVQGIIGVQQAWLCRENGQTEWRWLNWVSPQQANAAVGPTTPDTEKQK